MLREQLDRLTQELSACKAANEELETQRHQMEEALTGLVLQEKRLRQENQEQLEFIAQGKREGAVRKGVSELTAPPRSAQHNCPAADERNARGR